MRACFSIANGPDWRSSTRLRCRCRHAWRPSAPSGSACRRWRLVRVRAKAHASIFQQAHKRTHICTQATAHLTHARLCTTISPVSDHHHRQSRRKQNGINNLKRSLADMASIEEKLAHPPPAAAAPPPAAVAPAPQAKVMKASQFAGDLKISSFRFYMKPFALIMWK